MLMKVSMQALQSSSEEAYRRRPETREEYLVSAPLQLSPLGRGIHYPTRPVSSLRGEAARNAERSCGCGQFPF